MKLGISTLAWDSAANNTSIFTILKKHNILHLEVVLPKLLTWTSPDLTNTLQFFNTASEYGLRISSTQSILFNSNIVNLSDDYFLVHMLNVSNICAKLNISKLVFGAPTIRKGIKELALFKVFAYINEVVETNNQVLLIEPNSKVYGGEYFYTIEEISIFLQKYKFSNIGTMIDTHNSILEGVNPSKEFVQYSKIVQHVHISEIGLSDFVPSKCHTQFADTLKRNNYDDLLIYEAKPSSNFERSIELFNTTYSI